MHDYIKKHPECSGYEIVEYKDDGYSGTNFERPNFIELMSAVRQGIVSISCNYVVVMMAESTFFVPMVMLNVRRFI